MNQIVFILVQENARVRVSPIISMPSSFREEVLKAIDVLDSYCQQKDSLWYLVPLLVRL